VAVNDQTATAAAVADLVADLADATIEVSQPASLDGTTEPLEDYSVALLNRGTPGTVIEPDGTLHLSLMRSCSGWPSGVWTQPPRRTAPDGSSFAWQHWSHTFEYALASGTGDWRDAGFARAGHAYNHQFQTQLTGSHDGELAPSANLLEVDPADVMLTALNPHGNPFAAGRASRDGDITLRCQETRGRATQARIRCFVPLREGRTANVLEETRGNLDTPGGTLLIDLGPAQTVTATVTPDSGPRTGGPVLGPRREAAQPVYSRYWLHNKGPAAMGNQLVDVHAEPRAIDLTGDLTGPVPVQVTVSATRAAAGAVELIIPSCARREEPGDLRYDLAAGEYERFDVLLRPCDGAAPGIYHLRARITDSSGQMLEDVITVRAQDAEAPDELDIRLDTPTLAATPGGSVALRVCLASHSQDEIHGEAQLISPYGTWDLISPWTQGFTVPPGGQATLGYDVRIPAHARRTDTWALIKVMASGRAYYTASVPLAVGLPE
jgi:alpha-mannosidase